MREEKIARSETLQVVGWHRPAKGPWRVKWRAPLLLHTLFSQRKSYDIHLLLSELPLPETTLTSVRR